MKPIVFTHELDAAWIIALWLAIHGGDPAPSVEQIAVEAIAALSGTLTDKGAPVPAGQFKELQTRMKNIGIDFEHREVAPAAAGEHEALTAASVVGRTYCFIYKGQRICITLPRPVVWPPRQ